MTSVRISSRMMREGCPGVSRNHHLKILYYISAFPKQCNVQGVLYSRHHQLSSCKCKTSSVDIVDIVDIYLLLSIQGQGPRMRAPVRPRHLRRRRRTEDLLWASHTHHLNHAGKVKCQSRKLKRPLDKLCVLHLHEARAAGTGTD